MLEKGKTRAEKIGKEEDGDQDKSSDIDIEMDLEIENWAKYSIKESSSQNNDEKRDHTLKY